MSSADIRDVLELSSSAVSLSVKMPPTKKFKSDASGRKLEGIQRELASLLGENTPAVSILESKFKERPQWMQKPTPWHWRSFINPARSDTKNNNENDSRGLTLHHWVRGEGQYDRDQDGTEVDYAFAKFDTKALKLPVITQEIYDRLVSSTGSSSLALSNALIMEEKTEAEKLEAEKLEVKNGSVAVEPIMQIKDKDIEPNLEMKKEDNTEQVEKTDKSQTTENIDKSEKTETMGTSETLNTTEIAKTPNPVDLSETERGWTYEETRYLFELCSDYDLRWVVIYDRYDYKSPQPRVMEDLKERYYYVMYRLGQSTVSNSLSADTNNTIPAMNAVGMSSSPSPLFPREAELKRKQYLERLLQRSPSEVAEEEALVIKSRKLEAASKRMLAERADLLHLLDAPQASASVNQYQSSQGLSQFASSLLSADKNKKKKISKGDGEKGERVNSKSATPSANVANNATAQVGKPENIASSNTSTKATTHATVKGESSKKPITPHTIISNSATPNAGTPNISTPGVLTNAASSPPPPSSGLVAVAAAVAKKLSAKEEAAYGISYHDKLVPVGVFLRSSKLTAFKPAVAAKVAATLAELGVPPKPVMPTAKVCAKFESVLHSIGVLLEAKKQVDKLETELKILKSKK